MDEIRLVKGVQLEKSKFFKVSKPSDEKSSGVKSKEAEELEKLELSEKYSKNETLEAHKVLEELQNLNVNNEKSKQDLTSISDSLKSLKEEVGSEEETDGLQEYVEKSIDEINDFIKEANVKKDDIIPKELTTSEGVINTEELNKNIDKSIENIDKKIESLNLEQEEIISKVSSVVSIDITKEPEVTVDEKVKEIQNQIMQNPEENIKAQVKNLDGNIILAMSSFQL